MILKKEDNQHYVDKIKKEGTGGSYRLNWEKRGVDSFIVISNPNKENVVLNENNPVCDLIDKMSMELVMNQVVSDGDTTIYFVNFVELRRNGGLDIKEKPGYYAVYGCEFDGKEIKSIYVDLEKNKQIINITVDIVINQNNLYKETRTGLFRSKKVKVYSGYKEITIPRGISGASEYSIVYNIKNGEYSFPVPKEVLENGGTFYVSSKEDEKIDFKSNDNGIRIK